MKVKPTYKELENRIKELESRQNNSDIILNDFVFQNHIWIQNSPVCTKIVDLDFNLQFMSEAGVKVLKIENIEEYYGNQYPLNIFSDSFKISISKNLKKVKELGIITRDVEVLEINGQKIWFDSTIVPVYNEKGQPDYYLVISVDITEQKNIEEALKESEKSYRILAENAVDFIWEIDLELNIKYASPGAYKITGYTVDELMRMQVEEIFNEDRFVEVTNILAEEISLGKLHFGKTFESEYICKNGKRKPVEISAKIIWDKDFNPISISGRTSDITERKQVEQELIIAKEKAEESERKYHSFFDAAFESIFVSEKGICVDQNKKAELKFGYTLSEAIGKPGTDWISPEDRELVINNILSGREKPYRVNALTKAGVVFPCEIQASVTYFNGKELRITALRDITEEKLAEKELLKNRNHLEKLVKQRTIELEEEIKKLDSAVKAFVGREQKIKELTETIKILENKIKKQ